jgi:ABC-type multidrug transport system ATPase subunit
MLKRFKEQGITIIVSTPYMDEADLCDRIALMQKGKILSLDSPQNIKASYPEKLFAIKTDNMHELLKALENYEHTVNSYAFGEYAHASFKDNVSVKEKLVNYLQQRGSQNIVIEDAVVTIEDSFIKLLKQ